MLSTHNTSDGDPLHPVIDWSRITTEHFVHWYQSDDSIVRSVGAFISHGLRKGDAAIVISTGSHRLGIEQFLQSNGLEVEKLRRSGRYIPLDAFETLEKFMVENQPDRKRFFDTVGALVSRASNSWGGLRAFGEMVAILWESGNCDGAIQLENLWNELAEIYRFALFCAYPKRPVGSEEQREALAHVCNAHSLVIL